jgi:hypothetical protein
VDAALKRFNHSALISKGAEYYEINLNDPRLVLPRFGSSISKVIFNPEIALTDPDATILDAGHPLVRKLIELVKAEFFSKKGLYGRNAYFFSNDTETVVYLYNFLVRFTVGIKEKRVIEEMITFAVDSYDEKLLTKADFSQASTTRTLASEDLSEQITNALEFKTLDKLIQDKIKERRFKLIEERQELYNKILVESKNTDQPAWLSDILYIDEAGHDLLTVTIVQPL